MKAESIELKEQRMARKLTVGEVSVIANVSKATVRRWAKNGVIPSVKVSSKIIRFEPGDVAAALSPKARLV